jgi:NADH dehydrogenase FAD-containing subunit
MPEYSTSDSKPPSVVVVGGGYGGIAVAKALDEVADVVLVDPKDCFEHNVAALRALVEESWSSRIHFSYDGLLKRGQVIRDRAVQIDSRRVVLESGQELVPDFIVLATGSSYPFPGKSSTESSSCSEAPCASHHPRHLACQAPSQSPPRPAPRSRLISGFAATA